MVAIQIRSQFLRHWQPDGGAGVPGAFAVTAGDADHGADRSETRRKGHWAQRDLKRAIAAAEQAGLAAYRVEVAPDGTISIVVGDPSETAPERHPDG